MLCREICSLSKPGGEGARIEVVLQATKKAVDTSVNLHHILARSLLDLEETIKVEKQRRLDTFRRVNELKVASEKSRGIFNQGDMVGQNESLQVGGGLDDSDPILSFSSLHFAVPIQEDAR